MYSAEAVHEDMVLIHAFVLHISVEFGTQNNYCTILYIINERLALSETLQTGIKSEQMERNILLEIIL